MTGTLTLGLCICACFLTAGAQDHNLYKGDVCKLTAGQPWRCKLLSECPAALASLRQGQWPELCHFDGDKAVACCEPPPVGAMAIEMCFKYAEFVFMTCNNFTINMCAAVQPMIVRGMNTAPREFPHMALIGYEYEQTTLWACGGSLISERYVLSAAHCSKLDEIGIAKWVKLGVYNKSSTTVDDEESFKPVKYEIIERINHPQYYESSDGVLYNDIALFKLKEDVAFSPQIRPICLNTVVNLGTTDVIATGWGMTETDEESDILQKVHLKVIDPDQCYIIYEEGENKIDRNSMICAGEPNSGKDFSGTDSGGPLQIQLLKPYCMYTQVGITSFLPDRPNNTSFYPGVYTRVSNFIHWIEKIVWP